MTDLIRVSSVLRLLYPYGLDFIDQADLDRGTRLHSYMELYVNNLLHGYEYVPPTEIRPVLEKLKEEDIEFESAEERINHEYGYTGQPDCLARRRGKPWWFDWKFSETISQQNIIQGIAYSKMTGRRGAFVQCPKNGKVKIVECKHDPKLWAAFLSGLNVLKFQQLHQPMEASCQTNL